MKFLFNKLKQRQGASLIIALVFMLFCVFVGGSILAAAVANSARLQHTIEDDQDYLLLRSAAVVLADELRGTDNGTQLKIRKAKDNSGASYVDYKTKQGRDAWTSARDLLYFCASCQFYNQGDFNFGRNDLPQHGWTGGTDINTNLYVYRLKSDGLNPATNYTVISQDGAANGADFVQTDITVTLSLDDEATESVKACMVCGEEREEHTENSDAYAYYIYVYFYNPDGTTFSDKLHIEIPVKNFADTTDYFSVTWGAPRIVKGGRTV